MNDAMRLSELGFVRVGAAIPRLRVADVDFNVGEIIALMREAAEKNVQILVFPELAITGYTCQDLFLQKTLLDKAEQGLWRIVRETAKGVDVMIVVGMPVRAEGKLFNCGVVIHGGRILGVVPKSYIPGYKEFYEERWFSSARELRGREVTIAGQTVSFGTDILFRVSNIPDCVVGIEVCEDLWGALAPHEYQAHAGATIGVNLSASNEVLGKAEWRRTIVSAESGRSLFAYIYVSCGFGESSNDVIFGGHAIIAENGSILKESERFKRTSQLVTQDIDLDRLAHDRRLTTSFADRAHVETREFRIVSCKLSDPPCGKLEREVDAHPFVPSDSRVREERCKEIFAMLTGALAAKLEEAKTDRVLLGVSGGLDSTLAALVLAKTLDILKVPRSNGRAVTMPGFGTTRRTKRNALKLAQVLGFTTEEISIVASTTQHFADIGHNPADENTVFQNAQARYRTELLFNRANDPRAIVLGTGDLSEIALGWCTYGGDHMSHYHVLSSVPKTLVRYIIQWVAETPHLEPPAKSAGQAQTGGRLSRFLRQIIATPISPELTRSRSGKVEQESESYIGPYELNDFFLYHFIRTGASPAKILYLANVVLTRGLFKGSYTLEDLKKWLENFIRLFFANQFKRTCMPEGPKIGTVSLSPRGDWRMASGARPDAWLADLEKAYERIRKCARAG